MSQFSRAVHSMMIIDIEEEQGESDALIVMGFGHGEIQIIFFVCKAPTTTNPFFSLTTSLSDVLKLNRSIVARKFKGKKVVHVFMNVL